MDTAPHSRLVLVILSRSIHYRYCMTKYMIKLLFCLTIYYAFGMGTDNIIIFQAHSFTLKKKYKNII